MNSEDSKKENKNSRRYVACFFYGWLFFAVAVAFSPSKSVTAQSLENIQEAIERTHIENQKIKQIEDNKKKIANEQATKQQVTSGRNKIIRIVAGIVLAIFSLFFIKNWISETAPDREARKKEREREREYEETERRRQQEIAKENAIFELERNKQEQQEFYKALRTEIEQMPKYETWKQQVFTKYGKLCEICGATNNLEIHHRKSLHSIIKQSSIKDKYQAFECDLLWNVNNGSVVCSECHNCMESSQTHKKLNNEDI